MNDADRLRILYIGGWGRSGSTLAGRMLGQVPGLFYVGEGRDVWLRGVRENRLCGCGARFSECPFWSAVGAKAFGGWNRLDLDEMLGYRAEFDRPWSIGRSRRARAGRADPRLRRYLDVLGSLYGAMKSVSGADVIVDSSKIPSYAYLLRAIPETRVSVVHLVRDSRGVVFSWRKHILRPDSPEKTDYMLRYGVLPGSARYVLYNAQTHRIRSAKMPYLFLRYEDFVRRPREELRRMLKLAGVEAGDEALSFVADGAVTLEPNHTVIGNPMRLSHGSVPLATDQEWQTKMPASQRRLVTAVTAPLLLRYHYPLTPAPVERPSTRT